MGEPHHRVAANASIALRDIGPPVVLSQPEKYTLRALVWPPGQHDFITFVKFSTFRFNAHHHFRVSFRLSTARLWTKLHFIYNSRPFNLGSRCFLFTR